MTNKIKKRNNKRNNTGIPESRIFNFHQLKIKLKLDLPKGTSMFCQAIAISDKMQQRLFCHRY